MFYFFMVNHCDKCGFLDVEGKTQFFEAISDDKIISLCGKCAQFVDLPMIKRASYIEMKEGGRLIPKYNNPNNRQAASVSLSQTPKDAWPKNREPTLRDLVDRNLKTSGSEPAKERPDLIPNYHWVLMRARRSKKFTQDQLAKALQVPTHSIQSLEAGRVTFDDDDLLEKLEEFLGIYLFVEKVRKARIERTAKNFAEGNIVFDKKTIEGLTLGDLQSIHQLTGKKPYWKRVFSIFKRKKIELPAGEFDKKEEIKKNSSVDEEAKETENSDDGFPFHKYKEDSKKDDVSQGDNDDSMYRRR